jgi:effector-binding domain-containing protein
MPKENERLDLKKVDDMRVACIRFQGQHHKISEHLNRLYEKVRSYINGKPLSLFHGGNSKDGYLIEICFPVSRPIETEQIKSRILDGGWMICTTHAGPYGSPGDEGSLSQSWKNFYARIRDRGIGLAEGPPREVYLESGLEHGEDSQKYVTELQEYLLLPRWLARMSRELDRLAGEDIRHQVMAGSERLTALSPPDEKVQWVKGAMEQLTAVVNEETQREIMTGCAHIFPEERIQELRTQFQQLGDIDKLLELMGQDRSVGEHSFYSAPRREGKIIYTTKIPFDPKGYEEATDMVVKRYHYCHCPLVKEAILKGEKISSTFCYCGSGWFKRLWQGILEQPVKVEMLKSVLQGDDCCTFAIHLPSQKDSVHLGSKRS